MSASADRQLFQLYMELGDAQTQRQRPHEAADAYALALYYARRAGDAFAVQRCRELVLARSPNHVAGQALSAPLFFAQLLMRCPADEAAQTLAELRGGGVAAPPLPPASYALDLGPGAPAPAGDLAKPPYPAAEPSGFEPHHVFDLGGPLPAPRDDFHLREAGLLDPAPVEAAAPRRRLRDAALDIASYVAIAVGVGGGVFFATQLYPTLRNLDLAGAMKPADPAPQKPPDPPAPAAKQDDPPAAAPKAVDPPALAVPAPALPKLEAPKLEIPTLPAPPVSPKLDFAPPTLDPPKLPAVVEPPKAFAEAPKLPAPAPRPPAPKAALPASVAADLPPPVGWEPPRKDRAEPIDPTTLPPRPTKTGKRPLRPVAKSALNTPGRARPPADLEPPTSIDDALRLGVRPESGKPAN